MPIITINEISKRYNSAIKEFMNNGWDISPLTAYRNDMPITVRGFTDLVKCDSVKNDYCKICRAFLIEECGSVPCGKHRYPLNTISILVKEYECPSYDKPRNLSPDYGDTILQIKFYELKSRSIYTDSHDEMTNIIKLRNDRINSKHIDNKRSVPIEKLPDYIIDSLMRKINSVKGFKRAKSDSIKSIAPVMVSAEFWPYKKRVKYRVTYEYNSKTWCVFIG